MDSVDNKTLMDVFSMLMERTTKLENTIDNSIMHCQLNSTGSLDTSFLGLQYNVYVHQPLDNIYMGLDKYTDFYIETDLKYPYDILCRQISEGLFDKVLGTDVEVIKKDVQDELNEKGDDSLYRLCRDMPSVNSKCHDLSHYLIDVIVERYLTKTAADKLQPTKKYPEIYYDPENFTISFFASVEKSHSDSRFEFIKGITEPIQEIVKRIDPGHNIGQLTICPLTKQEASIMKEGHGLSDPKPHFEGRASHLTENVKKHLFWKEVSSLLFLKV